MMCEKCGKYAATTYVKRTVNGKTEEYHLCSACAQGYGAHTMWDGFGLDLGGFWGSLLEPTTRTAADTVRCEGCGRSFREMAEHGRAGCPQCYATFYDKLLPSIQRIHGKVQHTGKIPSTASEQVKKEKRRQQLEKELAENIEKQAYEECARLRDEIRALEVSDDE